MTSGVTVRYRDCDHSMRRADSFLSLLVAEATGSPVEVVDDVRLPVDLQFTSVQVPLRRKLTLEGGRLAGRALSRRVPRRDSRWKRENPEPIGNAGAHIWFTGENVRPPVGSWDGYLSFDLDPLGGRNAYLPLWWHSLGLLGQAGSIFTSVMPSWEKLIEARDPGPRRPKFACAFINNPEPMRLHAVEELKKVGQVDVYGGAVGRPVPDKAAVAEEYRFVLCFENDIYPGYVTEKPLEAWATGAIPLWRGADPAGYLNHAAMINAANFISLREFIEEVAALDADPARWASTAAQPIIVKEPELDPAKQVVRKALGLT